LYNQRYDDLIDTINHLLFHKLDQRIIEYLRELQNLKNQKILNLTHRQIANELGTAREVISRILKKLENDNIIIQHAGGIELL
jgi:CRP/FNR family transcriptional regulator